MEIEYVLIAFGSTITVCLIILAIKETIDKIKKKSINVMVDDKLPKVKSTPPMPQGKDPGEQCALCRGKIPDDCIGTNIPRDNECVYPGYDTNLDFITDHIIERGGYLDAMIASCRKELQLIRKLMEENHGN